MHHHQHMYTDRTWVHQPQLSDRDTTISLITLTNTKPSAHSYWQTLISSVDRYWQMHHHQHMYTDRTWVHQPQLSDRDTTISLITLTNTKPSAHSYWQTLISSVDRYWQMHHHQHIYTDRTWVHQPHLSDRDTTISLITLTNTKPSAHSYWQTLISSVDTYWQMHHHQHMYTDRTWVHQPQLSDRDTIISLITLMNTKPSAHSYWQTMLSAVDRYWPMHHHQHMYTDRTWVHQPQLSDTDTTISLIALTNTKPSAHSYWQTLISSVDTYWQMHHHQHMYTDRTWVHQPQLSDRDTTISLITLTNTKPSAHSYWQTMISAVDRYWPMHHHQHMYTDRTRFVSLVCFTSHR